MNGNAGVDLWEGGGADNWVEHVSESGRYDEECSRQNDALLVWILDVASRLSSREGMSDWSETRFAPHDPPRLRLRLPPHSSCVSHSPLAPGAASPMSAVRTIAAYRTF